MLKQGVIRFYKQTDFKILKVKVGIYLCVCALKMIVFGYILAFSRLLPRSCRSFKNGNLGLF